MPTVEVFDNGHIIEDNELQYKITINTSKFVHRRAPRAMHVFSTYAVAYYSHGLSQPSDATLLS